MSLSISSACPLTDYPIETSESRDYLVEMLDSIRRQEQAVALNKCRYLVLAERYGMRVTDIAEAVGMSASGVRRAVRLAKATPGGDL